MVVCDNSPPTCIVVLMLPLPMASKTVSSPMNNFLGEMCVKNIIRFKFQMLMNVLNIHQNSIFILVVVRLG
jgi:hypothetical protein